MTTLSEFVHRAAIGPIPGWAFLIIGVLYNAGWIALALWTFWLDWRKHNSRRKVVSMG